VLAKLNLQAFTVDSAYATLLALYILRECYADKESEYSLIQTKAELWLELGNIDNSERLVRMFTLKPRI